ncbi:conserved hypothetical protein [Sphingomonas sp. T1]|uniref:hypothetical protein n=1 Tax=Sphingomonas sp. T1 TaxID=2653172 RepID=UPI0012F11745|nr:hypothetical protein [Sphingomonas sp. T1]VXC81200.1 conserved hypothetical protein [Sphingomonas sp. T1]
MKHQAYFTRALKANDPRYARVFGKLGYDRADIGSDGAATLKPTGTGGTADDLEQLRAEYQAAVGKKPYHGWDAAVLREKIVEAKGSQV